MTVNREALREEVEDRFGVELPADGALSLDSPEAVAETVFEQIRTREPIDRDVADAFLDLRRVLAELARPGVRIRPSTNLSDFVPWAKRQPVWDALGRRLDVELPSLRRPREIVILGAWVVVTGVAFFGLFFYSFLIGALSVVGMVALCYAVTIPLVREFPLPSDDRTLAGLARLVARIRTGGDPAHSGWTRDEVIRRVHGLIDPPADAARE